MSSQAAQGARVLLGSFHEWTEMISVRFSRCNLLQQLLQLSKPRLPPGHFLPILKGFLEREERDASLASSYLSAFRLDTGILVKPLARSAISPCLRSWSCGDSPVAAVRCPSPQLSVSSSSLQPGHSPHAQHPKSGQRESDGVTGT